MKDSKMGSTKNRPGFGKRVHKEVKRGDYGNWKMVKSALKKKYGVNTPRAKDFRWMIIRNTLGYYDLQTQSEEVRHALINFFLELPLSELSGISSESKYLEWLDRQTRSLQEKIPGNNFGIARTAIDYYMLQAVHNVPLSSEYRLGRLIPYLEAPLTEHSVERLVDDAKEEGIELKLVYLEKLDEESNRAIQAFAIKDAKKEFGEFRCYFYM